METYTFTLIVDGPDVLSSENFERLEENGCDDASFGERDGVQYADFDREALSYVEAVTSAISDVESAISGLNVIRVESESLVGVSGIAERTGLTREYVRLLAHGQRGPGGFPLPLASLDGHRALWNWSDVASWFRNALHRSVDMEPHAAATQAINAILEYRRAREQVDPAEQIPLIRWTARYIEPLKWKTQQELTQSTIAALHARERQQIDLQEVLMRHISTVQDKLAEALNKITGIEDGQTSRTDIESSCWYQHRIVPGLRFTLEQRESYRESQPFTDGLFLLTYDQTLRSPFSVQTRSPIPFEDNQSSAFWKSLQSVGT